MGLNNMAPDELDMEILNEQRKLLSHDEKLEKFFPLRHIVSSIDDSLYALGKEFVSQGKACPLFLAGGQGTRLGANAPKGTYPISLKKKSLFQLFSEKIVACQKLIQREIPVLFMTSPENHEETFSFFNKNRFFGLKEEQVHFFM